MNTPEDDPASVADSRELTLGPLRFGGRAGAFGTIGRAS